MNKVLIIGNNELFLLPFSNNYIQILNEKNISYDYIYWNRTDKKIDDYEHYKVFSYNMNTYGNKLSKVKGYLNYRKFCINTLKRNNYDLVIVLNSQTAFLVGKYLIKHKIKYIFDYRDESLEKLSIYKKRINKVILNSEKSFFSSLGYLNFFSAKAKEKSQICHNVKFFELNKKTNIFVNYPINLTFWGMVRETEYYKLLMDIFSNDERVNIAIHGVGHLEELKEYAKSKAYTNISFSGKYTENEINKFISDTDCLFNAYPNESIQKYSLTCKMYDAIYAYIPTIVCKDSYMDKYLNDLAYPHFSIDVNEDKKIIIDSFIKWFNSLDFDSFKNKSNELIDLIKQDQIKFKEEINKILK